MTSCSPLCTAVLRPSTSSSPSLPRFIFNISVYSMDKHHKHICVEPIREQDDETAPETGSRDKLNPDQNHRGTEQLVVTVVLFVVCCCWCCWWWWCCCVVGVVEVMALFVVEWGCWAGAACSLCLGLKNFRGHDERTTALSLSVLGCSDWLVLTQSVFPQTSLTTRPPSH